jgi:signal-transduction protein with cAMP-binding, CBS, and nucleotidyltransferase domain
MAGDRIVGRGEIFDELFLIQSGEVFVHPSSADSPIAKLSEGAYFGDYQIFLDTRSNVAFVAHSKSILTCHFIEKKRFLELCNRYKGHTQFFMERATSTRRLYKRLIKV